MRVSNISGTSSYACRCGSWLNHWENYNFNRFRLPVVCSASGCGNTATDGAHVKLQNDGSWYIIPVCRKHNMSTVPYWIKPGTSLAYANQDITCGR